ncbi:hypothetical protein Tco_0858774 [Tanacetum coccineum]|uniref:Uncharacterized protein n=1 Tax=Tanacetum coccineum TaxID=301880 RepID=A0ABQ5BC86_9ASTR
MKNSPKLHCGDYNSPEKPREPSKTRALLDVMNVVTGNVRYVGDLTNYLQKAPSLSLLTTIFDGMLEHQIVELPAMQLYGNSFYKVGDVSRMERFIRAGPTLWSWEYSVTSSSAFGLLISRVSIFGLTLEITSSADSDEVMMFGSHLLYLSIDIGSLLVAEWTFEQVVVGNRITMYFLKTAYLKQSLVPV